MKRVLLSAAAISVGTALLLFAPPSGFADVVLQNGEDELFYYLPAPLGGGADLAADATAAVDFLRRNGPSLNYLPPSGAEVLASTEAVYVVGFYLGPGTEALRPVVARISPTPGVRTTFVVRRDMGVDARTSVSVWDLELPDHRVTLDNRYLDWVRVPDLARFSPSFTPVVFIREREGRRDLRKLEEAVYWGKGGSQLESFKSTFDRKRLYLLSESTSEITSGLSILIYCFQDRGADTAATHTIEVPARFASGPVLLWTKGNAKPLVVGRYARGSFFVEAAIDLDRLPDVFFSEAWAEAVFDLASCFFGPEFVEEFFFTTIAFRDLAGK